MNSHRGNAFDLLRLAAALLVVVGHSWVLTGHVDPLTFLSGTNAGDLGVGVFFLLSGYLVSSSWLSDPSLKRFAARRALRIYPAYALVVLVLTFLLGPLVTTLTTGEYLFGGGTWQFLLGNLSVFHVQFDLPGVFAGNPYPNAVDGSLWTIRVEVLCYVGVAALGLLGFLRCRWILLSVAAALMLVATVVEVSGYHGLLLPGLLDYQAAVPIAYFGVGMAYREFIGAQPPPWWTLPVTAFVWAALWITPAAPVGAIPFVAALTYTIAFRAPAAVQRPTGGYDLSYGTYLLAFPLQQLLSGLPAAANAALTAVIVLALAALSWRFVERPALRHKPSRPVPATTG
ncbi:acyltransferase family protein [Kutzneria sp. CA-103260]|uniref:acyltransferase family protein n=1 Tax=Kutzneria sp. CA-103260 TaxID=2802641 RepID=UPI001BA89405|nr:acyltransferase [Kutzneria sp. CA-103260]QUQ62980.1 acyltransferase [Kutzneria sp. CA-103260]